MSVRPGTRCVPDLTNERPVVGESERIHCVMVCLRRSRFRDEVGVQDSRRVDVRLQVGVGDDLVRNFRPDKEPDLRDVVCVGWINEAG